jgi:multimeric flavodoxin WrbA
MKRVTAFLGTASKKHTYNAVRQFLDNLQLLGGVDCEIVVLSDHRLGTCRGCKLCFEKGEESCPLRDDRDALLRKLESSDGVIFASPNYSFHVSAIMKTFLDRLGFIFHRPRFFGKTYTSLVAQGIYRGHKIVKYLDFVGKGLGFNTVKGLYFTALEPMTAKEKQKIAGAIAKQSERFYERLMKPAYPAPSLFMLMAFRMGRTSMKLELDEGSYDYRYYRDKGWFESDYFYPTRLGLLKRTAGRLFEMIQAWSTRKRNSQRA